MSEQRAAAGEQGAGADVDSAPVAEPEVVEAEVVEAEVVETDVDAAAEDGGGLDAVAEIERERDSYLELAQRARADFENYRRRVAGETAEAERRGRATVAKGLLPALDNLERALHASGFETEQAVDPGGEPPSEEVSARDALAAGVALVLHELRGALERAGVRSYDPVGERFDPTLHEAISTGHAEGVDPGTVLETLERGYRVDEQVIRPARVVVSG